MDTLKNIFLILIVILSFNFMIFIHELGHYLAARWRGLKIEKFQVWFGKPIWSKTINGVQYGLGWIPAGGFVSLPQLAPMDAIEGERTTDEPLPQKYPAAQGPVGAVRPKVAQYWPAKHGSHSSTARRLSTLLNEPGGQGYSSAKRVPSGQYAPTGQSIGVVVLTKQ